jgi:hypothetical protein
MKVGQLDAGYEWTSGRQFIATQSPIQITGMRKPVSG